jgi:hypothetical protein
VASEAKRISPIKWRRLVLPRNVGRSSRRAPFAEGEYAVDSVVAQRELERAGEPPMQGRESAGRTGYAPDGLALRLVCESPGKVTVKTVDPGPLCTSMAPR